jgi:hypothetical protein
MTVLANKQRMIQALIVPQSKPNHSNMSNLSEMVLPSLVNKLLNSRRSGCAPICPELTFVASRPRFGYYSLVRRGFSCTEIAKGPAR